MAKRSITYSVSDEEINEPYTSVENQAIGAINYITRYGGAWYSDEDQRADWRRLRKFILSNSDRTPQATKDLYKINTYTIRNILKKPQTLNKKAEADIVQNTSTVSKAIKCPASFQVVPRVKIISQNGNLLHDNITPVGRSKQGIVGYVTEFDAQLITNKGPQGGLPPYYQGSFNITFSLTNLDGQRSKASILNILGNDSSLNYVFRPGNPYTIQLSNQAKDNQTTPPECRGLISEKINLVVSTLKHTLVEWDPVKGEATFKIDYLPSRQVKEIYTKAALQVSKEERKKQEVSNKLRAQSLLKAIGDRLEKNKSVFEFTIRQESIENKATRIFNITNDTDAEQDTTATDTDTQTAPGPLVTAGSFFLFRSLLIATLQTFSEKHTTLGATPAGKKESFIRLYSNKEYESLRLMIDETTVPNELGNEFPDPGTDVRSTHETIAVNYDSLREYLEEMTQKQTFITFPDLVTGYFNSMLPKLMQRCIRAKQAWFQRSFGLGKNEEKVFYESDQYLDYALNKEGITYSGKTFKPRTANVRPAFLKLGDLSKFESRRKRFRIENRDISIIFKTGPFGRDKGFEESLSSYFATVRGNLWGNLRIKRIEETPLARALYEALPTSEYSYIFFKRKSDPALSADRIDPDVVRSLTAADRLKLGIIDLSWYNYVFTRNTRDLREASRTRIETTGDKSPFNFSTLENKEVDNMAAAEAIKSNQIRYALHSVSFAVRDVLGISPYVTDWYFAPQFFGFGNSKEDKFGYAGLYKTVSAGITLVNRSERFVTELTAQLQFDPAKVKPKKVAFNEDKFLENRREQKKKLRALESKLSDAKAELRRRRKNNYREIINDPDLVVGRRADSVFEKGAVLVFRGLAGAARAADFVTLGADSAVVSYISQKLDSDEVSNSEVAKQKQVVAQIEKEVSAKRKEVSNIDQELTNRTYDGDEEDE